MEGEVRFNRNQTNKRVDYFLFLKLAASLLSRFSRFPTPQSYEESFGPRDLKKDLKTDKKGICQAVHPA